MGIPEGEEREKGIEEMLETVTTEILSKLMSVNHRSKKLREQ